MANDVLSLLTLTMTKQGKIADPNNKRVEGDLKFSDGIEVHGFYFGIQTPADPNTLKLSGRRSYKPFTIYKKIDGTSPKLVQAAATGEVGTAMALFVNQIDSSGKPVKTLSYEFTNVIISQLQKFHGQAQGGGGAQGTFTHLHDYEQVDFLFESITVTHLVSKSMMSDSLLTGLK